MFDIKTSCRCWIFLINKEKQSNNVVHLDHYNRTSVEVIDTLRGMMTDDEYRGFLIGNVVKYISRYSLKNGIEDIEKAKYYLNLLEKDLKGVETDEW